jgi:hypothetical protein
LIGRHAGDTAEVIVGVETDRGLLVEGLVARGYEVFAINPFAASHYRDRQVTSGAKSDPGDAKVLADAVRTDRQNHQRVARDSAHAEAIKVLARAHRRLIWARQRHLNGLRSALREFYPGALLAFGTDLDTADAVRLRDVYRSAVCCMAARAVHVSPGPGALIQVPFGGPDQATDRSVPRWLAVLSDQPGGVPDPHVIDLGWQYLSEVVANEAGQPCPPSCDVAADPAAAGATGSGQRKIPRLLNRFSVPLLLDTQCSAPDQPRAGRPR